ncbi:hypothetical protein RND81_04G046900 [Saponaria officinalis]|uniref:Prolamin-like domain-containing protein n=1 Tax=Saponaria officinalis TaxID=3572 RepID=A0AAW1LKY1_SAPOF
MEYTTKLSCNLSFTVVLLVISLIMAKPSLAIEIASAPSPSSFDELKKCENGLGTTCGVSMYQYIFGNGVKVSKECCSRLLTVGKDCHDLLTQVTIIYKRLPEKQSKESHRKNGKVWELCKTVGHIYNYYSVLS